PAAPAQATPPQLPPPTAPVAPPSDGAMTVADVPPIAAAKPVDGTIELSGPLSAAGAPSLQKPTGVGSKTEPATDVTIAGTVELPATGSGKKPSPGASSEPISATRTVDIPASPSGPSKGDVTVQVSSSGTAGSGVVGRGQSSSRRRSRRIGDSGSFAEKTSGGASLEQLLVIQPRALTSEMLLGRQPGRGDYNLTRKLGEGGMGVVYAAEQSSIRRSVALKMLKGGGGSREAAQREKFLAEAVVTGDLEHPNIVPIYDLGRDEKGAVFYAMKHVKGTPWDKLLPKKSVVENVEILLKVADGVAFAHSRGVVHRDLKPENVMIGEFGEVLVMDWGLALSLDVPAAEVAMGGTPAYMAPEMTVGPMEQIDETSDVYLLGAILYEIVTGLRPHTGSTVMECLMASANNVIVPTDKSGELVDIALKAMATEQTDRYHSVPDFQQAIRDYQSHLESVALATRAGEDLAAARESGKYDLYSRALFAYQEAVALWDGNQRAKTGVDEAVHGYATAAFRAGDYDLGLSLLEGQEERHSELRRDLISARDERNSRQRRLQTARRIGVGMAATILVIVTVAFFWIRSEAERARQAELVAVKERNSAVEAEKATARARDDEKTQREKAVAAQRKEAIERQKAELARLAAEDAKKSEEAERKKAEMAERVAVNAQRQEAVERQKADMARIAAEVAKKKEEAERIKAEMAERVAVAAQKQEAIERQKAVDAEKLALAAKEAQEYAAYVARLGLAAAKIDENAFDHALTLLEECPPHLRNWEWGRLRYLCARDERTVKANTPLETLDVSRDGRRIAVGGWGGEVLVWELNANTPPVRIVTGAAEVFAVAFSPDGSQLAVGSSAKPQYVSLWDPRDGRRLGGLAGHSDSVLSVRFSRDGSRLLTGSYDNTARLWNLRDGSSKTFRGHDWWVWSAEFSGDEKRVVTASQDGTSIVWDTATGSASPPFLGHSGPVLAATFSPDGSLVASASQDQRVLLWDPQSLREIDFKEALGMNTGPKSIASGGAGSNVGGAARGPVSDSRSNLPVAATRPSIADPTGSVIATLRGHAAAVRSVQFSTDGRLLASAGYDNVVALWDVGQQRLLKKFRGHA
ncbi:MAG: protein kinase domain-containing protein, partial [Planctomycetota bacterium]